MRYQALACDYDGTLAFDGRVAPETIRALERLKRDRRTLLMVSGRELDDLRRVFSRLDLFERVVVENGALLASSQIKPCVADFQSLPAPNRVATSGGIDARTRGSPAMSRDAL